MHSRYLIGLFCFGFLASHDSTLAAAGPPTLSAVTAFATSPGTAVFSWQTDIPSTSQVVFVDGDYVASSASSQDPTLVTSHSVTVSVRPNTTYTYYVVSANQGASASSANNTSPTTISTPPVTATAPEDYRIATYGGTTVYQGYDMYVTMSATLLSGTVAHLYVDPPIGLPAGVTVHVICKYNPEFVNEQADSFWDSLGRQWCWNGNDSKITVRVRASVTAPPGQYQLTLRTEAGGVERDVAVKVQILSPPQPPIRQATAVPAIPNLELWQQKLTSLGQHWCDPAQTMAFGYEPQIWYYDGARTYFQLGDYTNNPALWEPCALNIIQQYRDRVLQANGYMNGWRVFPHGLAMNYWRSGDTRSRDAVLALANNSAYAASAGDVSVALIRETAYLIETLTIAKRLGAPNDPHLDRAIAFALGQCEQLFSSNSVAFNQPFMDGLLAEALIQYYEVNPDPRIPGAIKQMLDWVWLHGWDPATQQMIYNTIDVPQVHTADIANLVAPAYAWYWALTGDATYQQRGDQMFSSSLSPDISYSGKVFNQNYRWTFDYVKWRSTGTTAPSAFLAGWDSRRTSDGQLLAVTVAPSVIGSGNASGMVWLSSIVQQPTTVGLSSLSAASLNVQGSVTVPAGFQSAKFTVTAAPVAQLSEVTVVASLTGRSVQATTTIIPSTWNGIDVRDVYVSATYTKGGSSIVLYLTGAAPAGGIPVALTSSNPTAFPLPASVVIPAGATRYSVPVTVGVVSATTSIAIQGKVINTITRTIQVLPPPPVDLRDVYVSATYTKGGSSIVLYLTDVAPVGGIPVALTSSNPTAFPLPASVVIPAGATQYSVPVTVGVVSATTTITIQGKVINTITRTIQLVP